MSAIENSKQLKQQAELILKQVDLIKFLNNFGEAAVVGSVALDLMVWRDIDVDLLTQDNLLIDNVHKISNYLFNIDEIRKVTTIDYLKSSSKNDLTGYYIGAEYIDVNSETWKIDIWYKNQPDFREGIYSEDMFNEKDKSSVIEIKSKIFEHPFYRNKIKSVDIYDSVLNFGVENLEQFKSYLKQQKGIEI